MSFIYPKVKKNRDGTFGPTNNGYFYQSVYYHQKNARKNSNKTRWILNLNAEYYVFRIAMETGWLCHQNLALFSIINEGEELLGENDERIGYFKQPINSSDPWHGFPVKTYDFAPSSSVLDLWEASGVIPYHMKIKIEKRKI